MTRPLHPERPRPRRYHKRALPLQADPYEALVVAEREAAAYLRTVRIAIEAHEHEQELLLGRCRICHRVVVSQSHWRAYCSTSCRDQEPRQGDE